MTPDPEAGSATPRAKWPPDVQPMVDEYIARLSEGGDLWQRARDRERERWEREDEIVRIATEAEQRAWAELDRLTRGGPVRRMLRALFT